MPLLDSYSKHPCRHRRRNASYVPAHPVNGTAKRRRLSTSYRLPNLLPTILPLHAAYYLLLTVLREQLGPNIFQDVGGALDADLACQERVLVLDAQDALVA